MSIGPMPADVYRLDSCNRCARADNCYSTEIEVAYEGEVAICGGCIGDLAVAAGYDIAGTKLADAIARAETAEAEAADSKAKLAEAKRVLDSWNKPLPAPRKPAAK